MLKAAPSVVKAFDHQLESLSHNERTPIVFDCSDPGTGKTFVRIMAVAKRIKQRKVRKMLVLAPKTLLESVWAEDFKKFAPHLRVAVSTAGKHEKVFKEDADIYITNIDAVKWLAKQPKSFFAGFDELAVDESPAYKHHTSQRSKAISKISVHFKYRTCMTGTPNSNSITDVWHQVKILDGGKRLGPTFFGFRNAVCVPEQVGRSQHAIRWHDKEGAEEVVFGLLSDIVIRHKLEDCTDIPANHEYTLPFRMEGKHRKAYDQMAESAILEIYGTPVERAKAALANKKLIPKAHVTAINAAAVATKLLQIASGAVYEASNSDKYHLIDTARYEFVMDLVEQRKHSVVFFMWKHQRDLMVKEAEARGLTWAVIDGSTSQNERRDIVKRYQAGQYRTVFLHPQSAAHGLTLTRGTAAIWASPTANAEFFNQGSRRVYRISQKQKTETITVLAQDSYEERVYHEILTPKNGRMANLLDLFSTL
jgi:SNF2 family DNA or RNA helicase